jgi:elongation factor G
MAGLKDTFGGYMKKYQAASIRNVCLLSHGGVGKTSLLEAACYTSKATAKLGKVSNGTSIFDNRTDEKERKMTISTHVGFCEWNDTKVNFLDTPGFLDFLGDAKAALRVVESAIVLIDAQDGIQVGTELVSRLIEETKVPMVFFVNSIDKENANFEKTLTALKETYGTSVAPLTIPIGKGTGFKGVIDLIAREAYEYAKDGNGIGTKIAIPADMSAMVDEMRQALMESVAESDETLMNTYFEKGTLTDEELKKGLAVGVKQGTIQPLIVGCALYNMGVDHLLNAIASLCPGADTRAEVETTDGKTNTMTACGDAGQPLAFIFKTISEEHLGELNLVRVFSGKLATGQDLLNVARNHTERIGNMYFLRGKERTDTNEVLCGDIAGLLKLKDVHTNDTLADKTATMFVAPTVFPEPLVNVAISAKNKGDEDKLAVGFAKLHEEDVTFTYKFHGDIKQSILSAMGDIQIEVILDNLKNRFKVEVERKQPKISYRETITKPVKYVEYTHKKQTGGAGQYARVFIDLEPLPRGGGYEFVDKIVGGVIDQSFRPSVDKGVHAKLDEGILAGYPIVDVRVSLVDGKTHPVDSKDIAFQVAGREVFKKAFEMANPILLEPVVDLKVTIPDEYTGDIMGDLSSRRGKIGGMNPEGKYQTIVAKVPAAEVQNYSSTIRSITQGRGFFTKTFSHYETVPGEHAKKIIEAHAKSDTAAAE